MRFRPLHAALAIVLAAAIVVTAAAGTPPARRNAPTLDPAYAKRLAKDVTNAIADEHAALQQVGRKGIENHDTFLGSLSKSVGLLVHVKATSDSATESAMTGALREDRAAEAEGKKRNPNLGEIKAMIEQALRFKWTAHSHLMAIASTAPAPPAAPANAPLTACFFYVNNGPTTTVNVKIVNPNGAAVSGTVTYNGNGLNQTKPFSVDANGSVVIGFTVGSFGTAQITVQDGAQTLNLQSTLDQSNDQTTTDCH